MSARDHSLLVTPAAIAGVNVNRRIDMRIVRFWRSTKLVEMCFGSGFPVQQYVFVPWIAAGGSRRGCSGPPDAEPRRTGTGLACYIETDPLPGKLAKWGLGCRRAFCAPVEPRRHGE